MPEHDSLASELSRISSIPGVNENRCRQNQSNIKSRTKEDQIRKQNEKLTQNETQTHNETQIQTQTQTQAQIQIQKNKNKHKLKDSLTQTQTQTSTQQSQIHPYLPSNSHPLPETYISHPNYPFTYPLFASVAQPHVSVPHTPTYINHIPTVSNGTWSTLDPNVVEKGERNTKKKKKKKERKKRKILM